MAFAGSEKAVRQVAMRSPVAGRVSIKLDFEILQTYEAPAIGGQVMDEVFFGTLQGPEAQAITLEVFIEYILELAGDHDDFFGCQTMCRRIESGNILAFLCDGAFREAPVFS
jgi:hypothetical protein